MCLPRRAPCAGGIVVFTVEKPEVSSRLEGHAVISLTSPDEQTEDHLERVAYQEPMDSE